MGQRPMAVTGHGGDDLQTRSMRLDLARLDLARLDLARLDSARVTWLD
jgi:hypothetical protein